MTAQITIAGSIKINLPNMDGEETKKFIEHKIKESLDVLSARLYVNCKNGHFETDTTIEIGNISEFKGARDIFHIKQTDKLHERW